MHHGSGAPRALVWGDEFGGVSLDALWRFAQFFRRCERDVYHAEHRRICRGAAATLFRAIFRAGI